MKLCIAKYFACLVYCLQKEEMMIANHIHDALAQVRKLQEFILSKRFFMGYSGVAKMLGGVIALAGAGVMSLKGFPDSVLAHLAGWGVVLAAALVLNYGAFLWWFLFSSQAKRDMAKAMPVLDAIPSLAIGAVFSLAFVLGRHYELLFGTWMCLYGLAHLSYRQLLPMANYAVGVFYVICGSACLLLQTPFIKPWPMGFVFFTGELIGGIVLYRNNHVQKGDEPFK